MHAHADAGALCIWSYARDKWDLVEVRRWIGGWVVVIRVWGVRRGQVGSRGQARGQRNLVEVHVLGLCCIKARLFDELPVPCEQPFILSPSLLPPGMAAAAVNDPYPFTKMLNPVSVRGANAPCVLFLVHIVSGPQVSHATKAFTLACLVGPLTCLPECHAPSSPFLP